MSFSPSSALNCAVAAAVAAILGCGPNDGVKELEQGKAAYEARDLKKAERLFEKSAECGMQDVDRLLLVARVKLDLGCIDAAKEWLDKAKALDGNASDVRMLEAQILWHAKNYESAAELFSSLAEDAELDADIRAQALSGLGVVEVTRENRDLARIAFLRAIRLDRRNAAAWYHLGLLYRDGFGYNEAALEQFEIFVRLEVAASPRVQKVQRTVIPALKDIVAQSLADRPGVSNRDSAASAAAIAKAEAAWKKGAFKSALKCYQDALAADPMSYPAAMGLAKAWQKTDGTKKGLAKAFENYKLACSLRPSAITTFLTTGALAARLGYYAQAVQIYSRAVAASPTSFDALDGLIRSLRKVGGDKVKIAQAYQRYRESLPSKKR